MTRDDGFAWMDDPPQRKEKAPTAPSPVENAAPERAARETRATPKKKTASKKKAAPKKKRAPKKKAKRSTEARPSPRPSPSPSPSPSTSTSIQATEYFKRRWGHRNIQPIGKSFDNFGLDRRLERRSEPLLDFLYKRWFRVDARGIDGVPGEGPCLVVANHSGGPIPVDGLMLRTLMRREHPATRELRWLSEDVIHHMPFVGAAMARLGAVRACQPNAERLLREGNVVAVFPEGEQGIGKLYKDRYQLQRFGRGGFIRLAMRSGATLVPCAIVGAEESNPLLFKLEYMVRHFGIPYLPITPTFPLLGPLGLLPAPTKWIVRFGAPMALGSFDAAAGDDDVLVARLTEQVRKRIQGILNETVRARRSTLFG